MKYTNNDEKDMFLKLIEFSKKGLGTSYMIYLLLIGLGVTASLSVSLILIWTVSNSPQQCYYH